MQSFPTQLKQWLVRGLSLVLVLTIISSLALYFHGNQAIKWFDLSKLNFWALALTVLLLLISWLIEGLRIKVIAAGLGANLSLSKALGINLAAGFMGNITPFNSGGVPTQIYLLCNNGVVPGKASAIVTIRVIISTLLFTTFAPFLLLFYQRQFSAGIIHQITTVAVPLSIAFSLIMLAVIIWPQFAKRLITICLRPFLKTSLNQSIQAWAAKTLAELDIFHEAIREFRRGINFYLAILLTAAYWIAFFMIAPLLMFVFGLNASNVFINMVLLQFILVFLIAYLPIPGGSGLIEFSVYSLFIFIPLHLRAIFILLWRFLSYYLSTLVGGIILIKLINRSLPNPKVEVLD